MCDLNRPVCAIFIQLVDPLFARTCKSEIFPFPVCTVLPYPLVVNHSQLLLGVLFWTKIRGKYSKGKL